MALATRCPHCETVFKLDPHLLAPHDGRVRCGHCQEVFDAAHHRFELPEEHGAHGEAQHASIVDNDVAIGPSSPPPRPKLRRCPRPLPCARRLPHCVRWMSRRITRPARAAACRTAGMGIEKARQARVSSSGCAAT